MNNLQKWPISDIIGFRNPKFSLIAKSGKINQKEETLHPSISKEVLSTGIVPTPNKDKWLAPDIPYSAEEVIRVFGSIPGKPVFWTWGTWFRKCTKQRYMFNFEQAAESDRVSLSEVEEAINIAKSLRNSLDKSRLN